MTSPFSQNHYADYADTRIDLLAERLERGSAPLYAAQAELGKTLITLASASLVLSVSMVQLIAPRLTSPRHGWLVLVAWVCFGITVLVGAARQGWAGHGQAYRIRLEAVRAEIREAVADLDLSDDPAGNYDREFVQRAADALGPVDRAAKIHDVLTQLMYWTYAIGLCGLLAFACIDLRLP